jgi:hypothetical protein
MVNVVFSVVCKVGAANEDLLYTKCGRFWKLTKGYRGGYMFEELAGEGCKDGIISLRRLAVQSVNHEQ